MLLNGSNICLIPITIVGSAMGQVYYRDLSEVSHNENQITIVTSRALKISSIIAFAPILFLSLGGDKVLIWLLGPKWIAAGKMALCLSIYSLPVILTEPLLPAFRALDKQDVRLKLDILNFVLSIGSLIAFSFLCDNIYSVLTLYALFYAAGRYITFHVLRSITGVRITDIHRFLIPSIFLCYILVFARIIPLIFTLPA